MSLKHPYVSFKEQDLTSEEREQVRSNIGFADATSGKLDKTQFEEWKGSVEGSISLLDNEKQDALSDAQLQAIEDVSSKQDALTSQQIYNINNAITEHQSLADYAKQADLISHSANSTLHTSTAEKEAWNAKVDQAALANYTPNSAFNSHSANNNIHVTADDKASWNAKLDSGDLAGYATQSWVGQQNFATEGWVTTQDYATKNWVGDHNYITDTAASAAFATKTALNALDNAAMKTALLETNSDGKISGYNGTAFIAGEKNDHLVLGRSDDDIPGPLSTKLIPDLGKGINIQWKNYSDIGICGTIFTKVDGTTIDFDSTGKLTVVGDVGKTYSAGQGIKIEQEVIGLKDEVYSACSGAPWTVIDGPNTKVITDDDNNTICISAGAGGGTYSAGQGIEIVNNGIGLIDDVYNKVSGTAWSFADGPNTTVILDDTNHTISISSHETELPSMSGYLPISGGVCSGTYIIHDGNIRLIDYNDGVRQNSEGDFLVFGDAVWMKYHTSGDINENMAALGIRADSNGLPYGLLQKGGGAVGSWEAWGTKNFYAVETHAAGTEPQSTWANDKTIHLIFEE